VLHHASSFAALVPAGRVDGSRAPSFSGTLRGAPPGSNSRPVAAIPVGHTCAHTLLRFKAEHEIVARAVAAEASIAELEMQPHHFTEISLDPLQLTDI
jgi:hypothetical protein